MFHVSCDYFVRIPPQEGNMEIQCLSLSDMPMSPMTEVGFLLLWGGNWHPRLAVLRNHLCHTSLMLVPRTAQPMLRSVPLLLWPYGPVLKDPFWPENCDLSWHLPSVLHTGVASGNYLTPTVCFVGIPSTTRCMFAFPVTCSTYDLHLCPPLDGFHWVSALQSQLICTDRPQDPPSASPIAHEQLILH